MEIEVPENLLPTSAQIVRDAYLWYATVKAPENDDFIANNKPKITMRAYCYAELERAINAPLKVTETLETLTQMLKDKSFFEKNESIMEQKAFMCYILEIAADTDIRFKGSNLLDEFYSMLRNGRFETFVKDRIYDAFRKSDWVPSL